MSAVTAMLGVPVAAASMVAAQGNAPLTNVSPGAQVAIIRPAAGSVMQAGEDLPVEGTVAGLPSGDRLWVVLRSDSDPNGFYFLAQGTPVAYHDGTWQLASKLTGNNISKGHNITLIALQADSSCDDILFTLPSDDNGRLSLPAIPDGCVDRAERSIAVAP